MMNARTNQPPKRTGINKSGESDSRLVRPYIVSVIIGDRTANYRFKSAEEVKELELRFSGYVLTVGKILKLKAEA